MQEDWPLEKTSQDKNQSKNRELLRLSKLTLQFFYSILKSEISKKDVASLYRTCHKLERVWRDTFMCLESLEFLSVPIRLITLTNPMINA